MLLRLRGELIRYILSLDYLTFVLFYAFKTWICTFRLTRTFVKYFVTNRPKRSFYVFVVLIINVLVDVDNSANYLYSMMVEYGYVY